MFTKTPSSGSKTWNTLHTILSIFRLCDEFCWTHDTTPPCRPEANGISQTVVAILKLWNASVICNRYRISSLTKSHHINKDLMHHAMGHTIAFGAPTLLSSNVPRRQKSSYTSLVIEVLTGNFMGYALHAGGAWAEDMFIADWDDLVKNVASEVHVKRFRSKEIGITSGQDPFIFLCTDGSLKQEDYVQRHVLRHTQRKLLVYPTRRA